MVASVVQGLLKTECGKVTEIDGTNWYVWLAENQSFRYESNSNAPYTARKEKNDYWYGYRKVAGKLHKRYIGKTFDMTSKRLEEIGDALNTPSLPRQAKVTDTVTDKVTATIADSRIEALEAQVSKLERELSELRSQQQTRLNLPGAADLLNQLRVRRKKSKADLADVEALLELIAGTDD
jgi:archaellum component FlaC